MWTTLVLAAALATPSPAATPPKTITHLHVSPLCTGLRQNIGPAIGKVLDNDKAIAASRPLLRSYVKNVATSSARKDLDVSRLERLIGPLVQNTNAIEKLLADPYVFPKVPISDSDKQLLAIRAYLQQVVAQQKNALDVISGFVNTEQLGDLQAAGNQYQQMLNGGTPSNATHGESAQQAGIAPTPPPSGVLNAGVGAVGTANPARTNDPRFQETGNVVGHNPLDAFDQAIAQYQSELQGSEGQAADLVVKALPLCGSKAP